MKQKTLKDINEEAVKLGLAFKITVKPKPDTGYYLTLDSTDFYRELLANGEEEGIQVCFKNLVIWYGYHPWEENWLFQWADIQDDQMTIYFSK